MARYLAYTTPARGHLYPIVPMLGELRRRGHTVVVRTLADEVDRMRGLGFAASPIAAAIEAGALDDWKARSQTEALAHAARTFIDRARHEVPDLRAAIAAESPDALLIDVNAWGATAAAEDDEDWSQQPMDSPLPEPVASGAEPLLIIGAIAGG